MGYSGLLASHTSAFTRSLGTLTCVIIMTLPAMAQNHPAQGVLDADRAFAARAKAVGAGQAFGEFAESRVQMLNDPIPGSNAADLPKLFNPNLEIDWGPVDGAVSVDGTLGFTWGKARYFEHKADGTTEELPPTRYVTIWRRQSDGSWKYVADGGLNAPETKEFIARKKADSKAAGE